MSTWSFISAISGETTSVGRGAEHRRELVRQRLARAGRHQRERVRARRRLRGRRPPVPGRKVEAEEAAGGRGQVAPRTSVGRVGRPRAVARRRSARVRARIRDECVPLDRARAAPPGSDRAVKNGWPSGRRRLPSSSSVTATVARRDRRADRDDPARRRRGPAGLGVSRRGSPRSRTPSPRAGCRGRRRSVRPSPDSATTSGPSAPVSATDWRVRVGQDLRNGALVASARRVSSSSPESDDAQRPSPIAKLPPRPAAASTGVTQTPGGAAAGTTFGRSARARSRMPLAELGRGRGRGAGRRVGQRSGLAQNDASSSRQRSHPREVLLVEPALVRVEGVEGVAGRQLVNSAAPCPFRRPSSRSSRSRESPANMRLLIVPMG